ncbi:MAG TPA: hypothetical protein VF622_12560 [Segetibacter sp.]|jgi:hypothetical protein
MKMFKILSHPYTLIFSFLFILISGEHLGGFYALYIFLGLLPGAIHSILGFFGVLILVVSYHLPRTTKVFVKQCLNVVGTGLLFTSIYLFFKNDTAHYNWGTFEESVPVFTLVLFGLLGLCFLIGTFLKPRSSTGMIKNVLSRV